MTISPTPPAHPVPEKAPALLALVTVAVCLGFAAFTGHMWEDFLITFRASLHLATGHGLVFQPGERLHTFTSPLGTLLPALFALGGGENVVSVALWGLRLASAAALAATVWLTLRTYREHRLARGAATAATLAFALDPKIVDFSMNGMETAFVALFVLLTWRAFSTGARLWPCALGFAGLQWTRPDGCVYFGAIAGAWLLVGAARDVPWRTRCLAIARAVIVGGLLYLPWFLFAWLYYGTPVPHTITAKAAPREAAELATTLALYPWRLLFGHAALHNLFMPAYYFFGGWPTALGWISRTLAVGASLAWLWPSVARPGRLASAALFLGGFYLAIIPAAPWYHPGWLTLAWLAWGYLLHAVATHRPAPGWGATARIAAGLIVVFQLGLFVCVTWQMRCQQKLIEEDNRTAIGRFLRKTAAPHDTVFLECLGYIGFYSGLKMLDFPGLSSREVVDTRRAGHTSWSQIVLTLRPTWLVLRPHEAIDLFAAAPALRAHYRFTRAFDQTLALDALGLIPGRGYLEQDATFIVYHRTGADEPPH